MKLVVAGHNFPPTAADGARYHTKLAGDQVNLVTVSVVKNALLSLCDFNDLPVH